MANAAALVVILGLLLFMMWFCLQIFALVIPLHG